jgi:murein DD-endopeptidase MepM/ murein hydrolase activator NlpD
MDGEFLLMKKVNFFEKISSGKGFYITATICVCVIIAAIALIYNSSLSMLKSAVPEGTTAEVQKNQTGVSDPRGTTIRPKEETTTKKNEPTTVRATNEPSRVVTTAAPTEPTFIKTESFMLPTSGGVIKGFSISPVFDETMGDWRSHGGTDFKADEGQEIKAVGNGRVSKVISDPGWGYIIEIDCGDFTARYCGLLQGTTVKTGDTVSEGDTVGAVGIIPCESAVESHIHLEIIKDGDRVDPENILGK